MLNQAQKPTILLSLALTLLPGGCPTTSQPTANEDTSTQVGTAGAKGAQGDAGPEGPAGPAGPVGPAGADGQLRIYGDGSAGDVNVATDSTIDTLNPQGNFQFRNLSIAPGATLTVPSGTILRCTGTFINNGTLAVGPGGLGGVGGGSSDTASGVNASPGVSLSSAAAGESGDQTAVRRGGDGGSGLPQTQAEVSLEFAPGGGGGGYAYQDNGGAGGGGVLILADGAIFNFGTIAADGQSGPYTASGGGAGGVVFLASPTSIENDGTISARGGKGGDYAFNEGAGGGGGGGIVHFFSPKIDIAVGTIDVSAGAGGAGGTAAAGSRIGGGGGGACGGSGGKAGSIINAPLNTGQAGQPGAVGWIIQSLTSPTALFD